MTESSAMAASVTLSPAMDPGFYVAGISVSAQALDRILPNIAESDVPVLIIGEKGTGKRTLALQIHKVSPRRSGPFKEFDCQQLEPGSFLKAESCNNDFEHGWPSGGTVFLKEIGELGATQQSTLMGELPEPTNGGNVATSLPTRLIGSSSRDFLDEIAKGNFREDLYYRTGWLRIDLAPLRHRKEDILRFADHFLEKYSIAFGRPKLFLSSGIRNYFLNYAWPGNIRQLEDAIKALVAVGDEHIALSTLRSLEDTHNSDSAPRISLKHATRAASRQVEKELILKVLSRTRWNRKRAAEELQISYKALLYKLKQSGLYPENATKDKWGVRNE